MKENSKIFEITWTEKCSTLSSNTTATSRTFPVLKVSIMRNFDLYCLKAHNLRFVLAIFQSTGPSGLVSTWYWNLTRFPQKIAFFSIFMLKNCANFMKIKKKWPKWLRIFGISSIIKIFQKFFTIENFLPKVKYFLIRNLLKLAKKLFYSNRCGGQTVWASAIKFCMKKL